MRDIPSTNQSPSPSLAAASPLIIPDEALTDPLLWLKEQNYTLFNCTATPYDRTRLDAFQPQPYLPYLWQRTHDSGRSRLGSLGPLFCGMSDLSCDAITSYLHGRLVLIMGEYRSSPSLIDPADPLPENFEELCQPRLHALGYAFPAAVPIITSQDQQHNSMFIGYTFFQEAWRTPQQIILLYLGLAFLFQEFRLVSLHGIRYADNGLTAKLASKFGFQDIGTIPNYMLRESTGELAAATISTLSRQVFVDLLRGVLQELRAG